MKKSLRLSSIYLGVLTASVLSSSVALAHKGEMMHHNYKGEQVAPCPPPPCKVLRDGFYVGAQAGYDSYRVRASSADADIFTSALPGIGTEIRAVSANPVLNAVGAVGGGFIGYGMYFPEWYNLYLGIEAFANGSAANTSFDVTRTEYYPAVNATETFDHAREVEVTAKWNWGVSVLPGVKLNDATLAYARLGYARHKLEVETSEAFFVPSTTVLPDGLAGAFESSDTNWYNGFAYGLGIESVFYPNWSIRGDYTHTDLGSNTNEITGTEFSVSDNQFMLSLIYHFDMTNIFA